MASTAASSTTYAARQQATITIPNPGGGDGLVALAGALWVKTDPGYLVRIDPARNRVTRSIKLDTVSNPTKFCLGLGSDGRSVWACATTDHGTDVIQVDPVTMRIVRHVPVGKIFTQLALPATPRGIWSLTGEQGKTVSVVDPATGRIRGYPIATPCAQLVTRAVYPGLQATYDGDLVSAAGSVWLREGNGTITRIDPGSGRPVERITPDRALSGGSLLIAYGSIWATASDEGLLYRLKPTA